MAGTGTANVGRRDLGVDLARGVALLSMFVAHTAPADGPAHVLTLSEYLTAPLFATLIGMGTFLSWRRLDGQANRVGRFFAAVAVRSVALIVIGVLLERLHAQVLVVLVHLGLLTVLAALLVRFSPLVVAAVGVACAVLGAELEPHETVTLLGNALFGPYGLTHMLPWACLGIVLARRSELNARRIRGDVLATVLALALAFAMLVVRWAGAYTMLPYERNLPDIVFDALLCVAVVCGCAALVRMVGGPVVRTVAAAGAMTLTLYVAQVLVLAAFVALNPNTRDDSWPMLTGLVVGSLGFAALWHAVVRAGPFARGPLEGVVDLGVRSAQRRWRRPSEPAGVGSPASR